MIGNHWEHLDEPTKAVIASEDGTFLKHNGFDFIAMQKPTKANREMKNKRRKLYPNKRQECISFGSKE
jgi:hypothetical protein